MQFLGQLWIIAAVLFLRVNFLLLFTILWEKNPQLVRDECMMILPQMGKKCAKAMKSMCKSYTALILERFHWTSNLLNDKLAMFHQTAKVGQKNLYALKLQRYVHWELHIFQYRMNLSLSKPSPIFAFPCKQLTHSLLLLRLDWYVWWRCPLKSCWCRWL